MPKNVKFKRDADEYKFQLSTFVFKYHNKFSPENFYFNFFTILFTNLEVYDYNTRRKSSHNFYHNSVKTNSGKSSIKLFDV